MSPTSRAALVNLRRAARDFARVADGQDSEAAALAERRLETAALFYARQLDTEDAFRVVGTLPVVCQFCGSPVAANAAPWCCDQRRAWVLKTAAGEHAVLPWPPGAPERCTLTIELELEGDPGDARLVLEGYLDAGILQDEINDHESDAGPVRVVSAVVR